MNKLLGAVLALFLFGCTTAAAVAPVAQAAPQACQGSSPSLAELKSMAQQHGLVMAADYKGPEATAFNDFLTQHVVERAIEEPFDEILIFVKDKTALIVWVNHGCGVSHAVGPYQSLEPFVGHGA